MHELSSITYFSYFFSVNQKFSDSENCVKKFANKHYYQHFFGLIIEKEANCLLWFLDRERLNIRSNSNILKTCFHIKFFFYTRKYSLLSEIQNFLIHIFPMINEDFLRFGIQLSIMKLEIINTTRSITTLDMIFRFMICKHSVCVCVCVHVHVRECQCGF